MMSARLLPRKPRRTVASPPTSRIAALRKINQASIFMSLLMPSVVPPPDQDVEKQLNRNWEEKAKRKPTKPLPQRRVRVPGLDRGNCLPGHPRHAGQLLL